MKIRITCVALAVGIFLGGAQAYANGMTFYNARSLGMGGANMVTTKDAAGTQYYNPANFGFFNNKDSKSADNIGTKKVGLDAVITGGVKAEDGFVDNVDNLADIDFESLNGLTFDTPDNVKTAIKLADELSKLQDSDLGILANATGSFATRFNNFGIGVRCSSEASAAVTSVDTRNLGVSSVDVNNDLEAMVLAGNDGATSYFTVAQQAELTAAGLSAVAIQNLDYLARTSGADIDNPQGMVNLLADLIDQSINSTGNIDNNTTTITAKGFQLVEVPLSYGRKINDYISVGGNVKLMIGRVYGTETLVFDDSAEDAISDAQDNYEETTTFGIDLSVAGRYKKFGFALTGRNLNSPNFKGFKSDYLLSNGQVKQMNISDVKLTPHVTAGVAYMPFQTVTIEASVDLTKQETVLNGYETQYANIGAEWDIYRFLALRLGAYTNLADSDSDPVITAGLGVNLWAARIDLAGAMSTKTAEYDGDTIPEETQLALNISFDF